MVYYDTKKMNKELNQNLLQPGFNLGLTEDTEQENYKL